MAYFKKKPANKKEGKIFYCKGIVEDIVVLAIKDVPFVELCTNRSVSGKYSDVKVDYSKEGVVIDIFLKIHHSQRVSDMAFKLQEIVRREVESMTEYRVLGVNINVKDVFMQIEDKTSGDVQTNSNDNNSRQDDAVKIQTENVNQEQPADEQKEIKG